ncbi:MAG: anti-sigma F factor [Defluviitaleaceae bacterium]|nr:anti-sigma F factor [Defluviitaleaceae bacterium]
MNKAKLEISALTENVSLARVIAAAFASPFDPTVEEVTEIKTAVSEAVTNAIIHGYDSENDVLVQSSQTVEISLLEHNREITIIVTDKGKGIENIESAREPLFTTKPEMERSGLGFTVMEEFMTSIEVTSRPGEGTSIKLVKKLAEVR